MWKKRNTKGKFFYNNIERVNISHNLLFLYNLREILNLRYVSHVNLFSQSIKRIGVPLIFSWSQFKTFVATIHLVPYMNVRINRLNKSEEIEKIQFDLRTIGALTCSLSPHLVPFPRSLSSFFSIFLEPVFNIAPYWVRLYICMKRF